MTGEIIRWSEISNPKSSDWSIKIKNFIYLLFIYKIIFNRPITSTILSTHPFYDKMIVPNHLIISLITGLLFEQIINKMISTR